MVRSENYVWYADALYICCKICDEQISKYTLLSYMQRFYLRNYRVTFMAQATPSGNSEKHGGYCLNEYGASLRVQLQPDFGTHTCFSLVEAHYGSEALYHAGPLLIGRLPQYDPLARKLLMNSTGISEHLVDLTTFGGSGVAKYCYARYTYSPKKKPLVVTVEMGKAYGCTYGRGILHSRSCRKRTKICRSDRKFSGADEVIVECCCGGKHLCNQDMMFYNALTLIPSELQGLDHAKGMDRLMNPNVRIDAANDNARKMEIVFQQPNCYTESVYRSIFMWSIRSSLDENYQVFCNVHYDYAKKKIVSLLPHNNILLTTAASPRVYYTNGMCAFVEVRISSSVPEACPEDIYDMDDTLIGRIVYVCTCSAARRKGSEPCDRKLAKKTITKAKESASQLPFCYHGHVHHTSFGEAPSGFSPYRSKVVLRRYGGHESVIVLSGETRSGVYSEEDSITFTLCKLGCVLPNFDGKLASSFRNGQKFFRSVTLIRNNSIASPAFVKLLCADVARDMSLKGDIALLSDNTDTTTMQYFVVAVVREKLNAEEVAVESVLSFIFVSCGVSSYQFLRRLLNNKSECNVMYKTSGRTVPFSVGTRSGKESLRFHAITISPDGRASEERTSKWYSVQELCYTTTKMNLFVRRQVCFASSVKSTWDSLQVECECFLLVARTAVLKVLVNESVTVTIGWAPTSMPLICALDIEHSTGTSIWKHAFKPDSSLTITLSGLGFSNDYKLHIFPSSSGQRSSSSYGTLRFSTSACRYLTNDLYLCGNSLHSPLPVRDLRWKDDGAGGLAVHWDYDAASISSRLSFYFMVTIRPIFTIQNSECQFLDVNHSVVSEDIRSLAVGVSEWHCNYEAEVVVVDSKNRTSSSVFKRSVIPYKLPSDHGDSKVISSEFRGHSDISFIAFTVYDGSVTLLRLAASKRAFFEGELLNRPTRNGETGTSEREAQSGAEGNNCNQGAVTSSNSSGGFGRGHALYAEAASEEAVAVSDDDFSRYTPIVRSSTSGEISPAETIISVEFDRSDVTNRFGGDKTTWCRSFCSGRSSFLQDECTFRRLEARTVFYAVPFYDCLQLYGLVYECCEGGDLKCLLKRMHERAGELARDSTAIYRPIRNAAEYLCLRRYVHRDIAARNVLLSKHLSSDPFELVPDQTVKIADFGMCIALGDADEVIRKRKCCVPYKWLPYEFWTHNTYGFEGDVWEFGCFLIEVVTFGGDPCVIVQCNELYRPRADIEQYLSRLSTGFTSLLVPLCHLFRTTNELSSISLVPLIGRCLTVDKSQRATFEEISGYLRNFSPRNVSIV
ncbi:unnamed protein product [Toxocara canis]|uniref:Protein kinase domain-containing protein n=1 Tax=Toxocara canis TaxID=6265 RepID=A0A183UGN2_TOXCA|nr:unnamed protein product [Toxocara canis]